MIGIQAGFDLTRAGHWLVAISGALLVLWGVAPAQSQTPSYDRIMEILEPQCFYEMTYNDTDFCIPLLLDKAPRLDPQLYSPATLQADLADQMEGYARSLAANRVQAAMGYVSLYSLSDADRARAESQINAWKQTFLTDAAARQAAYASRVDEFRSGCADRGRCAILAFSLADDLTPTGLARVLDQECRQINTPIVCWRAAEAFAAAGDFDAVDGLTHFLCTSRIHCEAVAGLYHVTGEFDRANAFMPFACESGVVQACTALHATHMANGAGQIDLSRICIEDDTTRCSFDDFIDPDIVFAPANGIPDDFSFIARVMFNAESVELWGERCAADEQHACDFLIYTYRLKDRDWNYAYSLFGLSSLDATREAEGRNYSRVRMGCDDGDVAICDFEDEYFSYPEIGDYEASLNACLDAFEMKACLSFLATTRDQGHPRRMDVINIACNRDSRGMNALCASLARADEVGTDIISNIIDTCHSFESCQRIFSMRMYQIGQAHSEARDAGALSPDQRGSRWTGYYQHCRLFDRANECGEFYRMVLRNYVEDEWADRYIYRDMRPEEIEYVQQGLARPCFAPRFRSAIWCDDYFHFMALGLQPGGHLATPAMHPNFDDRLAWINVLEAELEDCQSRLSECGPHNSTIETVQALLATAERRALSEKQEAERRAYEVWYNSPEQVRLREEARERRLAELERLRAQQRLEEAAELRRLQQDRERRSGFWSSLGNAFLEAGRATYGPAPTGDDWVTAMRAQAEQQRRVAEYQRNPQAAWDEWERTTQAMSARRTQANAAPASPSNSTSSAASSRPLSSSVASASGLCEYEESGEYQRDREAVGRAISQRREATDRSDLQALRAFDVFSAEQYSALQATRQRRCGDRSGPSRAVPN